MALTDESGGMSTTMLVGPASTGAYGTPYPVYMGGGNGTSGSNGWDSGW